MAWFLNRRKLWADAPRWLRTVGITSAMLSVSVLFLGFYFTTGTRQANFSAAVHYQRSTAVSNAVTVYTHSCDILASSHNIRSLAELSAPSAAQATLANQASQTVWNVNAGLDDSSSVAIYFPAISLAVTKNQFRFSADFNNIFSANYPGLSWEQILEQGSGSWHSYYADEICYIVRSLQNGAQTSAYIVAKFPVASVFSTAERDIAIIGDSNHCLYSSKAGLPDGFYDSLMSAIRADRQITVSGVRYYTVRNEFSNLSLRFFTLVPVVTTAVLIVRFSACVLFLALLAVPVLLFRRFERRRRQEQEAAMTPKACEKDSQYVISGLARRLLDIQYDYGYSFSRQVYGHIHFAPGETCLLAGFALLEDQQMLFNNAAKPGNRRPITPYFILSNMLQDLLYDRHTGCLCYCSSKYIAICNLLPDETEADIKAILNQVVESAQKYLYIAFIAVGPVTCQGYEGLHPAITQVSRQLEYERLWWRTEKIPAADIQERNTIDFYNRVGLLNGCILENNYVKAEETFLSILRDCIPTGVDQVHEAESRLRLLLGTLVSLTGYPWDQLPANSVPPKTVAACQEAGEQILRAQLSMQDSAGANPAKDRIRAISEYVQENYTDSELGVGTIAARFGMNAAYLSRAFKDGTGTNLLEFIQRTRIAAAKKLLQEYAVKEVSTMVGFADAQSFVRTFRKYESVSPAEYKRNCSFSNDSLPK